MKDRCVYYYAVFQAWINFLFVIFKTLKGISNGEHMGSLSQLLGSASYAAALNS